MAKTSETEINVKYRWFYTYFNGHRRPSVCLALAEIHGLEGIGVAICSESETPKRKEGRRLARARALYGCIADRPQLPVLTRKTLEVLNKTGHFKRDENIAAFRPWLYIRYKAIPSGSEYFEHLVKGIWPKWHTEAQPNSEPKPSP